MGEGGWATTKSYTSRLTQRDRNFRCCGSRGARLKTVGLVPESARTSIYKQCSFQDATTLDHSWCTHKTKCSHALIGRTFSLRAVDLIRKEPRLPSSKSPPSPALSQLVSSLLLHLRPSVSHQYTSHLPSTSSLSINKSTHTTRVFCNHRKNDWRQIWRQGQRQQDVAIVSQPITFTWSLQY